MLRMMMGMALLSIVLFFTMPANAASGAGRVAYSSGEAWVERGKDRREIRRGETVLRNDYIVTGKRGRVKLVMSDGTKVYVGAKSRVGLRKYSMRGKNLFQASFDMVWGKARFFVNKLVARNSSFKVRTSTAVLGVRGTSILAEVNPVDFATNFTLMSGFAEVSPLNARGEAMGFQMVNMGQTAIVGADHSMVVVQASAKDMSQAKPENWEASPQAQAGSKQGVNQEKAKPDEPKQEEPKKKEVKQKEVKQSEAPVAKVKVADAPQSKTPALKASPQSKAAPPPAVAAPVIVLPVTPLPVATAPIIPTIDTSAGKLAQETAQQLAQQTAQQASQQTAQQAAQQTAQQVAQQVTQQITQQVTQQVTQQIVTTVIQNTNTSVNIQPRFVLP